VEIQVDETMLNDKKEGQSSLGEVGESFV